VCDACACAKGHQLPYSVSSRTSSAPLELVHSDVWDLAIDSFGRKNIMSVLLMIIVSLHGFTYYAKNLRSPNAFLNFSSLLNVCLITRSLPFNLIGGGEYGKLNSFFSDNRDLSSGFLPSHSTIKWCC
jgi:phosphoglycerol transferase MdoB-like AlkP superfamily enzyme